MVTVEGQRGKLPRIINRLEAGLVVETTASDALYVPAGCIHATFTMKGGYLVGNEFTTSKSIKAISALITSGLDRSASHDVWEEYFTWFKCCLDVTLLHKEINEALQAWIRAQCHLKKWASSNEVWRREILNIWKKYDWKGDQTTCPCGSQDSSTALFAHLSDKHLYFLGKRSRN
jgi:hypothetical protein